MLRLVINNKLFLIHITVMTIRFFVIMYSIYYMATNRKKHNFYVITVLFSFSIIILLSSNNLITFFIGWDLLGVTRFYLVIHYIRKTTINNGIITYSCNRVGDVILLAIIYIISNINDFFTLRLSLTFILCRITKRAQLPFSS